MDSDLLFNEVGIRESIAKILFEHIQILKQKLAKQIKREVSEQELSELPIFYDIKVLANLDWSNEKKFLKFCQQKLFIYLLSN